MSFELTILGSSSATPVYNRHPTSQLLVFRDRHFLIDCGEATQMQMLKFKLRYHRITHILISHLHGDHYLGLTGLLSTFHLQGRTTDLHLFGQQELMDIIEMHLRLSHTQLRYNLIFHPIRHYSPETLLEDEDIYVRTVVLNHRIPCTGFIFGEKPRPRRLKVDKLQEYNIPFTQYSRIKSGENFTDGEGTIIRNEELTEDSIPPRRYAYCSDTIYMPELAETVKGVDLLYHEATFLHDLKERANATFHSTAKEAASIALEAGVGKLLIGHFSARYKQLDAFLEEATAIFPNTDLAVEGQVYRID
ncbi:MAG: ribonuclease Z [Bacteroidetes bacterium]|nr:ribonuclease Z [Bacteroidota bacterium]